MSDTRLKCVEDCSGVWYGLLAWQRLLGNNMTNRQEMAVYVILRNSLLNTLYCRLKKIHQLGNSFKTY